MKKFLLFTLFTVFGLSVFSQTIISSDIMGSTTLTAANSPYLVTVLISSHSTLTIEPGVTILFSQGAGLKIYGTLNAEGTESSPIIFTTENQISPVMGSWQGLWLVTATSNPSIYLDYCKISYANYGLYIPSSAKSESSLVSLSCKNTEFKMNSTGLTEGELSNYETIESCSFLNNNSGVSGYFLTLTKCYFHGNNSAGGGYRVNFICCVFEENPVGISGYQCSSKNCLFKSNGIALLGNISDPYVTVTSTNSVFLNNTLASRNWGYGLANCTLCNIVNIETNAGSNFPGNCWGTTDSAAIASKIVIAGTNTPAGANFWPIIDEDCDFVPDSTACISLWYGKNDIPVDRKAFRLYPNPASDVIRLELPEQEKINTIRIFELSGKLCLEIKNARGLTEVDVSKLNSGIYLVEAVSKSNCYTEKFVK